MSARIGASNEPERPPAAASDLRPVLDDDRHTPMTALAEPEPEQIETIEAESRRELTDVLLSGNYMTSEGLSQALEHQIQDTLHQLLTWKTGSYHFSGDSRTVPKFAVNVRLNTEGLLMESMRRIDEIVRYRETLSSPAMVLRPRPLATPPKEMSPQERRILPLVDGLRPLRDLVAQSKLVEFEAFEALHHLLDLGVVEVSLGAAPQKVTPIAPVPQAAPVRRRTANSFGRCGRRGGHGRRIRDRVLGDPWPSLPRGAGRGAARRRPSTRDRARR